jgi:hypothetical protein
MTITLLITAYVLNVFLNRWLNKLIYKHNHYDDDLMTAIWFIPIVSTIFLFIIFIDVSSTKEKNWFTGKYWK